MIEGFGAATKGGWQPGYDVYLVTSLMDSGPGTLREGLTIPPGLASFVSRIDGTIALSSALLVPSISPSTGAATPSRLSGKGLILLGSDDVIIINLAIVNVAPESEDGLRIGDPTFGPSERVVVDHVTFRATGNNGDSAYVDEAMSVIFGSKDITLSWLRFENWEKVLLVGNGDASQAVDSAITVSWHHCYFKGTGRRHPQARFGIVDMWNVLLRRLAHVRLLVRLSVPRELRGAVAGRRARAGGAVVVPPAQQPPLGQRLSGQRCDPVRNQRKARWHWFGDHQRQHCAAGLQRRLHRLDRLDAPVFDHPRYRERDLADPARDASRQHALTRVLPLEERLHRGQQPVDVGVLGHRDAADLDVVPLLRGLDLGRQRALRRFLRVDHVEVRRVSPRQSTGRS